MSNHQLGNCYKIKKYYSKRGIVTIEAAIFLPIFLVGLLTFAYLLKFLIIQEQVFHDLSDEAKLVAANAINQPHYPLGFETHLMNRIQDDCGEKIQNLELSQFKYLYQDDTTNLIFMNLEYDVRVNLPIQFVDDLHLEEKLLMRGFVGHRVDENPMSFEELEKEVEFEIVWVFPNSGTKYHQQNCIYITSQPREVVLSQDIRHRYHPCEICKSKEIENGSLVYCFPNYGESYHTSECSVIKKYVIPMEKSEAIEKGYLPCTKCSK